MNTTAQAFLATALVVLVTAASAEPVAKPGTKTQSVRKATSKVQVSLAEFLPGLAQALKEEKTLFKRMPSARNRLKDAIGQLTTVKETTFAIQEDSIVKEVSGKYVCKEMRVRPEGDMSAITAHRLKGYGRTWALSAETGPTEYVVDDRGSYRYAKTKVYLSIKLLGHPPAAIGFTNEKWYKVIPGTRLRPGKAKVSVSAMSVGPFRLWNGPDTSARKKTKGSGVFFLALGIGEKTPDPFFSLNEEKGTS